MSKWRHLAAAALFVAGCLAAPAKIYCAGDPWYGDMRRHWAEPYVRVLWEESVTDGYIPRLEPDAAKYWPDDYCTRAQLVTLLLKVFDLPPARPPTPTYPDVPRSYLLFWNKPAWQFIEGAHNGGITLASAGSAFRPDTTINREDSVELLVRSLGLTPYADSIPVSEQASILKRFWDNDRVSPARRRSMACAVKLGIIEGYEDDSLRPTRSLTRGEAATIVARSCMIRMSARADSFSPDGDGVNDQAVFDLSYLKNRGIVSWQAAIEDSQGSAIRYMGAPGSPGCPPSSLAWDGRSDDGSPVPSQTYYYQALVTDAPGRQYTSIRRQIRVSRTSLTAWLQPPSCRDWDRFVVAAVTEPAALSVTVTLANAATRPMTDLASGTQWQASIAVDPSLPEGPQDVMVSARFSDTSRAAGLRFTRILGIWLDPSVSPNPAHWGQSLALRCQTPPGLQSVQAALFGTTVGLTETKGGVWEGRSAVPWGCTPGEHPVRFAARSASDSDEFTIHLTVRGPDTADLTYVLTR